MGFMSAGDTHKYESKGYVFAGAYAGYKSRAMEDAKFLKGAGYKTLLEKYTHNGKVNYRLWKKKVAKKK
jgi:hypothetical protein